MNIMFLIKTAGDVVLHFIKMETLLSIILFVIVFILSQTIGKKSPYVQIGLWSLLLLRLVLPPALSTDISLGRALEAISMANPFIDNTIKDHPDYFIPLENLVTVNASTIHNASRPLLHFLSPILLIGWISGVMIFSGVFYARIRRYKKLISHSQEVSSLPFIMLVNKWQKIFKVKRSVRLVTTDDNISPFTTGVLHPVIFIPASLLTSDNPQLLEPVIAHEMAHIKSCDALWIRIQNIIHSIYFFNPVVWFANFKINQTREYLCDSRVLMTQKINRENYGKGLLYILKQNLPGMDCPAFIPGFKSPTQNMKNRINKIKGEKLMKRSHIILSGICILLAGLFLLPMAGKTEKTATAQAETIAQDDFTQLAINTAQEMQPATKMTFKKPLEQYTITAQFGAEFMFNNNKIKHKGIDLKAPRGTNTFAAANGIVTTAEENYTDGKGYGKYIVIQHDNGFKTLYAHLDKITIQNNTPVEAGQVIGQVGNTGQSTGPHLHFELIHQDESIDPASYIAF